MSKQVRTVVYKRIRAGLILSVINICFQEGECGAKADCILMRTAVFALTGLGYA